MTITVRPHDLGDAPDSTNHFGMPMSAYPAVQANYPTVHDPALGVPIGPMHRHPRPFHLGQNVSREAGADVGPDEDPLNNIEPAANDPDNDRFDDGINPNAWSLAHCQTRVIPVRVFISPQAVNWFQQQGTPAYINVWLDGNRDGDWADGFNCPPDQAGVEHIVIDRAVNVVALGAGVHTINVATGLIPWPAALAQQPAWVRITLSDRVSNKPLTFGGITYGDGRGYPCPSTPARPKTSMRGLKASPAPGRTWTWIVSGVAHWDGSKALCARHRSSPRPARSASRSTTQYRFAPGQRCSR